MEKIKVGFIGAGGIARAHVYALQALKFYYPGVKEIELKAVTSAKQASRSQFAEKYGFEKSLDLESFMNHGDINTVYILSPNNLHHTHIESVLKMTGVDRIYLEKPVCSSKGEEEQMAGWIGSLSKDKRIQIGFQFLFSSSIRDALNFWREHDLGRPVHFSFTYKHTDYLKDSYREKRRSRLTPAPDGGAMADLGSHVLSLLVAFMGNSLTITHALQGGSFDDVPAASDLYSEISLFDRQTGAVGHLSASRISAGMGDVQTFEIFCEKGALRYNSYFPDRYEYCMEKENQWTTVFTGSNFQPLTGFPSKHVPGGWLRPLIHAHYVFLHNDDPGAFHPDLKHGLEVQRLVRETAEHMEAFRKKVGWQ